MEQKVSAFSRQALDSRGGSRLGKSLFSLKSNQNAHRPGVVSSNLKSAGKGTDETTKLFQNEEEASKVESESSGQSGPSTASIMKEGGVDAQQVEAIAQILKNDDEDFEFEEATVESRFDSYLDRITKDFD